MSNLRIHLDKLCGYNLQHMTWEEVDAYISYLRITDIKEIREHFSNAISSNSPTMDSDIWSGIVSSCDRNIQEDRNRKLSKLGI
jgi:hypothetical protein